MLEKGNQWWGRDVEQIDVDLNLKKKTVLWRAMKIQWSLNLSQFIISPWKKNELTIFLIHYKRRQQIMWSKRKSLM